MGAKVQEQPQSWISEPLGASGPVNPQTQPATPKGASTMGVNGQVFNVIDRNRDGFITRGEWNQAMQGVPMAAPQGQPVPVQVACARPPLMLAPGQCRPPPLHPGFAQPVPGPPAG